ncbi:MAG TPA: hypothetical protein VGF99_18710 [Myxococcota bacterium]
MKKQLAVVVGAVSLVYMFVPEPTDLIPIIGWLDEGVAGALLLWSMKTLGVSPSSIMKKLTGRDTAPATVRIDN